MEAMHNIALRVDDVGSASKLHEVYGKNRLGNFLFLKYLKPFRAWGPYEELSVIQWEAIFNYCRNHHYKLTLGVTAAWVEKDGNLTPFPEKYPAQAKILKEAMREGVVEIANHGLTHCVLANGAFKPKLFSSNRKWHREFWDWVPTEIQEEHIQKSQNILQDYFQEKVLTFIPPGNVFTETTLEIAAQYGLRYLSCNRTEEVKGRHMTVIPNDSVVAFHDKELGEFGIDWFQSLEEKIKGKRVNFIKEIGKELERLHHETLA